MNKLYRIKQVTRFRRWCRKAYAMFCSLGKCVTIGNLKKGIADVSLEKLPNVCVLFSVCKFAEEDDEDKANEELNPLENLLQMFLVQPQLQVVDVDSLLLLVICNSIAEKMHYAPFRLFFCNN